MGAGSQMRKGKWQLYQCSDLSEWGLFRSVTFFTGMCFCCCCCLTKASILEITGSKEAPFLSLIENTQWRGIFSSVLTLCLRILGAHKWGSSKKDRASTAQLNLGPEPTLPNTSFLRNEHKISLPLSYSKLNKEFSSHSLNINIADKKKFFLKIQGANTYLCQHYRSTRRAGKAAQAGTSHRRWGFLGLRAAHPKKNQVVWRTETLRFFLNPKEANLS